MAPNLLSISTGTNPMEALMVSQKASQLLTLLVQARVQELRDDAPAIERLMSEAAASELA